MTDGQNFFLLANLSGIAIGSIATYFLTKKKYSKLGFEALDASRTLTQALDHQIEVLSTKCGELEDLLTRSREEEKKQRRLAELHISKNSQFDEQARTTWKMHQDFAIRAGHAQAWLFRELENAVLLINKLRSEKNLPAIEVNPKLVELVSEMKREPSAKDPINVNS